MLTRQGEEQRQRVPSRAKNEGKNPLAEGNMAHLRKSKETTGWSRVIKIESGGG